MSKAKFEPGEVLTVKGDEFEVITVSAQELSDDKLGNYVYELQLKSEVDAKRKLNAEAQAAEKEASDGKEN